MAIWRFNALIKKATSLFNKTEKTKEYRLPNLILAGTQKSGSSWTHFYLSSLNEVYGSEVKELNYFNKSGHTENALEDYKKNFIVGDERYYLESTSHYFRPPNKLDIAQQIFDTLSFQQDLKLIIIFRNPVERALSAIVHHMMRDRIEYDQLITEVGNQFMIKELGLYYAALMHWKAVFGERLGVFFYDDLESRPEEFVRQLHSFLSIELDLSKSRQLFKKRVNDRQKKKIVLGKDFLPKVEMRVVEDLYAFYKEDIEKLFDYLEVDYADWHDVSKIYHKFNAENA